MPSRWARWALVHEGHGWPGEAGQVADLAGMVHPISMIAARCCDRSSSRVSGSPMSLLKLPCVARHGIAVLGGENGGDHFWSSSCRSSR